MTSPKKGLHAYAETYDQLYKNHADYRMKPWRQMVYEQWLRKRGFPEMRYVDIGCGRAESLDIARSVWPEASIQGCDIAPVLAEREDVVLLPEGARKLPFKSGTADLVSCCDVLEHMTRIEIPMALAEIARILKPSGVAMIGIPHKHTTNALHITIEDASWWEGQFRTCRGFDEKFASMDQEFDIPDIKKPYSFWELRKA